jgi:hypothetical protein
MDDKAKALLDRFDDLNNERSTYEQNWQDIRELVRPGAADFQRQNSPGDVRTERIYDGTAPQALEELANALHSFLTSPSERWFILETVNATNDPEELEWLEVVSDLIYTEYSGDGSAFNSSLQECYQDVAAFGNCVLNQEYIEGLRFRAISLADSFITEDAGGKVDGVYRRVNMSNRQLEQMFGDAVPEAVIEEANSGKSKKYETLHMVFPRKDRVPFRLDKKNMPFASFWVMREPAPVVLRESGFRSLPYHVGRWTKLANETYGRGPAIKCLPDIRMLNRMEFTNIKAAQKAADPPLMVPSDGYLGNIKTAPGSLNMREPGAEKIEQMPTSDKILVALEYTEQKRNFIRQCFYSDWVKLVPKKERQTQFEIAELVEQQLRMMAPMFGRIETELIGPMIQRSYNLLLDAGKIPPPPNSLKGGRMKVAYTSTAAQAQKGQKAIQMARYTQELIPLAQVAPDVMDAIDTDGYAQLLALVRGTPRRILRTPEGIAAIREARAQAQQVQQLTETLEPASKAVKNLAEAQGAGSIL